MEFVDGRDLQSILEANGSMAEHKIRALFADPSRGILAGLQAVHDMQLVHRDVTLRNIMVEKGTGMPKLIDFGLAKGKYLWALSSTFSICPQADASCAGVRSTASGEPSIENEIPARFMTRCNAIEGTPEYMSPEQWRGIEADIGIQTDIWSAGVCLWHLSTGKLPFVAPTRKCMLSNALSHLSSA